MDEIVKKLVSMIIQDLRSNNQGFLVDLIKKAECTLDFLEHDNWNGGIDYYRLSFHIKYSDFAKIIEKKEQYETIVDNALKRLYFDDKNVITGVDFVAKIEQYVDWAAITPKETKESVLSLINEEKDILIKAGTGIIQIRDTKENNNYKSKHQHLIAILKQLGLNSVHTYNDLWDWYNDYKQKEMITYQSRRNYIRDIYEPLISVISNSEECKSNLISYEATGWDKVDSSVERMKEILIEANVTADYQSVGMYGRELLITLAQTVFIKEKHPSADGTEIGKADSKRMLEAYINYCLKRRSKEREIKFAKSSIDFSNELTHNRIATPMDAELCYNAVLSTIHIIRVLNKYNDAE